MPQTVCCFGNCHNSLYKLQKWLDRRCKKHESDHRYCPCPRPYELFCFPRDDLSRNLWIKRMINVDPSKGGNWRPGQRDRVCSVHFTGGKPISHDPLQIRRSEVPENAASHNLERSSPSSSGMQSEDTIIDSLKTLLRSQPSLTKNSTVPKEELAYYMFGRNVELTMEGIQKLLTDAVARGEIIALGGNYKLPDRKMLLLLNENKVSGAKNEEVLDDPEGMRKRRRKPDLVPLKRTYERAEANPIEEPAERKQERTRRRKRARVVFDPSDFDSTFGGKQAAKAEHSSQNAASQSKAAKKRASDHKTVSETSQSDSKKTQGRQKVTTPLSSENEDWSLAVDSPLESNDGIPEDTVTKNPGLCHKCGANKINSRDEMEGLIFCANCSVGVHPSCVCLTGMAARKARVSPWLCLTCESEACRECSKTDFPEDTKLTCSTCENFFHKDCVGADLIPSSSEVDWTCQKCRNTKSSRGSPPEKPVHSQLKLKIEEGRAFIEKLPSRFLVLPPGLSYYGLNTRKDTAAPNGLIDVPNPIEWTSDDVSDYFAKAGFENAAQAFKELEIDGTVLLLMNREDVLKGMKLKIGVALKIFQHVVSMQYRFKPE